MTFKLKILSGLSAIHTSKSTRKINMSKCLCFPWRFLCVLIRWSLNSFSSVGCVHCSLLMISSVVERTTCTVIVGHVLQSSSHEENVPQQVLIRSLCSYSWFLCFLPINNEHWILPIMLWYPEHTSQSTCCFTLAIGQDSRECCLICSYRGPHLFRLGGLGGDRKWRGILGSVCLALVDGYFYPARYCEEY